MISNYRLIAVAAIVGAIGAAVCLCLAAAQVISPWIVVAVTLLLAFLLASMLIGRSGLGEIHQSLDILSADLDADLPTLYKSGPVPRELWQAIIRLVRLLRERIKTLRQEVGTAHQVLSSLPDALLIINRRREVIDANAAAHELFGDHLLRRDLSAALRNPAVLDAVDAVLRGGPDRIVEFDLAVPVELHLSARIAPLPRLADGLGPAALITLLDLTTMKRAEQMRVDFVANASHELRTPLSALLGFIETIQGPAAEDQEAQQRFLGIMHQQATRMTRLVEDLLSLSRIELNEHQPPLDRVALRPVLQQLIQALELKGGGARHADRDQNRRWVYRFGAAVNHRRCRGADPGVSEPDRKFAEIRPRRDTCNGDGHGLPNACAPALPSACRIRATAFHAAICRA